MKRIYYSSGSVLTGDFIADAILDYAELLASRHSSAKVDFPVVLLNGDPGHAQLLIGPVMTLMTVSEVVARRVQHVWDEDVACRTVRDMRARIQSLTLGDRATPQSVGSERTDYIPDFGGL